MSSRLIDWLIDPILKAQKAEDETARLYQEFVESFQGESGTKTFVRGGTINPGDKPKADSEGKKKGYIAFNLFVTLLCVLSF